jgi:abortive infection bacteriophage resistance protein
MKNKNFNKPATSTEEQIRLLRSRGIIINNEITAAHSLTYISYYRFCGYAIDFEI